MTLASKIPAFLLALAACLAAPQSAGGKPAGMDFPSQAYEPGSHDSIRTGDPVEHALRYHGHLSNRLAFLSSRFEGGKNPRALELADKIRDLLARAKSEIDAGRPDLAFPMLHYAEGLCAELGRLSSEPLPFDPYSNPGGPLDPFKDQRPAVNQNALADAWTLHRRLQEHLLRLRDRPGASADEKARSLQYRVQDLLDKSKESLIAGKADAGRELALKAEALLAELHLVVAGGPSMHGDASRRRLEDRIQRGFDLIRRNPGSGNSGRLADVSSLLEKARADLAAGRPESAEQSLKQAEKLLSAPGTLAGGRLGNASLDRLQGKLEKAGTLVKASGSEKAARILEKGLEHFAKAERFRADGQAVRAQAEMDIALKLAAKAVDIAGATGR
jgi:hypothetical protein